ncbi:uncharacterized protein LOC124177399 [Neodiprion fabricii]|uniref:uncharacterized protein LOC124177399 n=1 Tax=Neodiprion fabricii TaxID=2872261 RepID=UPI001ED8EC87|nr:uncharacterized protein LOC124177399 [Neodiprion fabricii]
MGSSCVEFLTIVITLFLSQTRVLEIHGEIVVLQNPRAETKLSRQLTCISDDDDDSALIWNNYNGAVNSLRDFEPKKPVQASTSKCGLWNYSKYCIAPWGITGNWNFIESGIEPMGPVFDYRWEDFEELVFGNQLRSQDYQYVRNVDGDSGAVVFSVRGSRDAYVLLCEDRNPTKAPCFWIVIEGWNTASAILSCANGAPQPTQYSKTVNCVRLAYLEHYRADYIDSQEWNTFGLKWNRDEKTISVYKNTDDKPFLEARLNHWHSIAHMSVRSDMGTRFRFHFYNYLSTRVSNAVLSTSGFDHQGKNFCVKLLVSLCAECSLNVTLVDQQGNDIPIGTISGIDKKSVYDGMLSWQSLKLTKTLQSIISRRFKLRARTILIDSTDTYTKHWAIDNFRLCESDETTRESSLTISRYSTQSTWPLASCQKLSYTESVTIDSSLGKNDCDTCPPGRVRSLKTISISSNNVTIQWIPPFHKDGKIVKYSVLIEQNNLLACEDLNRQSPPRVKIQRMVTNTSTSFDDLHPYANYTVTVSAYTTEKGMERKLVFRTNPTEDISHSAMISHLHLDKEKRHLEWDEPEDCTTILSPYKTVAFSFANVNETVEIARKNIPIRDFHYRLDKLNLKPHTEYRVRAYVLGDDETRANQTNYEQLVWVTQPTVPSPVTEIETYEADVERSTISVRWKPPYPANGEIESYHVKVTERDERLINRSFETPKEVSRCKLWEEYVCLENITLRRNFSVSITVQISAKNKNVVESGIQKTVEFPSNHWFSSHGSLPKNLRGISMGHGIVMLKWEHPSLPLFKITQFRVKADLLSSKLLKTDEKYETTINHPTMERDRKEYSARIRLTTSSSFKLSVVALNRYNLSGETSEYEISTPFGAAFAIGEEVRVKCNGELSVIEIPSLTNGTRNTIVQVVGKPIRVTSQQNESEQSGFGMKFFSTEYRLNDSMPKSLALNNSLRSYCFKKVKDSWAIVITATDGFTGSTIILANLQDPQPISYEDNQWWTRLGLSLPLLILICFCSAVILLGLLFAWHR